VKHAAIAIDPSTAARSLLRAQGLSDDPERRITPAGLQTLIERMGFVQIDTINVVERAHHLTLFSRVHQYDPRMLATLLERRRSLFEHWTHDAAAIPTRWFPHWRHRFARYRERARMRAWWSARLGNDPDRLIARVRDHIAAHGPVQSRDFERDAASPSPEKGWWNWSPEKAALEHLWRSGELAIVKRVNFQKHYDLTERVLPEHHALSTPDDAEHVDWACRSALERLGVANPTELAAFWAAIGIASARAWCQAGLAAGELVAVSVANGADPSAKPYQGVTWAKSAAGLRRLDRAASAGLDDAAPIRVLSPFDPVLRDRARTARWFGFDYRFEAFVPLPQRRYGYYVMPLLQDDRLIGRIDPKLHRDRGELVVAGVFWEPGIRPTPARKAALEQSLSRLASFVGADRVRIEPAQKRGRPGPRPRRA
jgi:uncharacterized protein YcaQ